MQKSLNTNLIKERLVEYGLNQSSLSKELDVSREAVSQWLKNKTLPKPAKLLSLGKLLKLGYSELITEEVRREPKIAFRKVGNSKTPNSHIKRAKEMGFALEQLVEFLPHELMIKPPELKSPVNSYEYIQSAANLIRDKFNITDIGIKFNEIISIINSFNAIFIPVMLGTKSNHENAIHIYLPESQTTWIYINLDTKIFDFKFWLSHELGHILTPQFSNNGAEDFADNFAGAFLFPEDLAKRKYYEVSNFKRQADKINSIISTAYDIIISPITILKEINKYAVSQKLSKINIGNTFYAATNKFTNSYNLMSEFLLGTKKTNAEKYIRLSENKFETIFFNLLRKYNKKNGLTSSYIKSILNIPITDAKEIYDYLTNVAN